MADPLGWPAIIGMVGGLVGLAGGIASYRPQFSHEHRSWRDRPPRSLQAGGVVVGCFAVELKGSWDTGAPADPWLLRCADQTRPVAGSSTKSSCSEPTASCEFQ